MAMEKREIDECSKEMESLDLDNSYETDEEEEEPVETHLELVEREMWKSLRESNMGREREILDNCYIDENTWYNSTVLYFSEDNLSKEEDLCQVWETKVEPLFKRYGLKCQLNWDERKMTVGTKTALVGDWGILNRGACALAVLTRGFSTECLERIFSCEVHCQYMNLRIPDKMSKDEFSSKYQKFVEKIDEFELPEKLSCFIIFGEGAIFVYSDKPWSTYKMKNLVNWCLLGEEPFERDNFHELSLDDDDDDY
ncbi:hypothetical protein ACLB2K_057475 [Fragaria x ananassa]